MFEVGGARILVTGGNGFLGSHIVEDLGRTGATVIAPGSAEFDLRRRDQIDQLLEQSRPDAVIHLAAVVGGIGANRAEPGRFFYENALMGIELLDACRVAAVPKVVISGTVCAYPKFTPLPFCEEDLWNGYPEETNAPYGLAKKMLLVQAQAYREQYGCNYVYLLPVNLFGPRDSFDLEAGHVIPVMIRKFIAARERGEDSVVLWGDGSPTREFLYVGDAARAFRLALERYDAPDPVNIGSGEEISIRDLATSIADVTGYEGRIRWDTTKPNGQPRRKLDTSRAREAFGFVATTLFRDGLRETVAFFSELAAADTLATRR